MKELYQALIRAKRNIPPMVEDTKGQDGNRTYQYYTWDQIVDKVFPVLWDEGLDVQHVCGHDIGPDGQRFEWMRCELIHAETGQKKESVHPCPDFGESKIKEIGGFYTYMERYSTRVIIGLRAGAEDNDEIVDKRFNRGTRKAPPSRRVAGARKAGKDFMAVRATARETPDKERSEKAYADLCNALSDVTQIKDLDDIVANVNASDQQGLLSEDMKADLRNRWSEKQRELMEDTP